MAYETLYQFYDLLMEEVPYHQYTQLVKRYANKDNYILDIACGTGSVLVRLIEAGYLVDGLDLSDEMLLITKQKLNNQKLNAHLFHDDMRNINIEDTYQCIYSFLDSINYLHNEKDIFHTFTRVYKALKQNGYFIFDVHSIHNVHEIFDGFCYNEVSDDYSYLWNAYVEKEDYYSTVHHEFNFFIEQTNKLYKRFIEYHKQVIYPYEKYKNLLEKIGFCIDHILYDFKESGSDKDCQKIIFIAKKCLT